MMRRLAIRRLAASAFLVLLTLGPALVAHADDYDAEISAIDNAFDAGIVRIRPGRSVGWSNDGNSPHTVTADDGSFDSGNLEPGATFTRAFDRPGVYSYFCKYHGAPGVGMTGIVVVGDVEIPSASGGGVSPGREPVPGGFAPTVLVPADHPTVQEGVDHAEPGGMVLIAPGVYHEAVVVTTPFVTIRGEDRNRTILDGNDELPNGIHVIEADGVTVENLTARHFVLNGVQWSSVFGFRASYVTAYDNGDYGIYAFDSQYGQFDHSYAGGSPDSGFYIGQCDPCHALITDSLAENNAMGYSGTNAGGDLAIVNSEWRDNMAGIVPNTLDSEEDPPQRDVLIAGNYVHDNNSTTADTKNLEYPTYGVGILIAGGIEDTVTQNLVEDQATYGIAVIPNLDANLWTTGGNEVRDNIVRRSGRSDLALGAPSAGGDCFAGNHPRTSVPPHIETLYGCDGPSLRWFGGGDLAPTLDAGFRFLDALDGEFPHGDWKAQPAPGPQPQMENPLTAPPFPADPSALPQSYRIRDPAAIRSAPGPRVSKEVLVFGIPLATSWWSLILGLYAYVLPGFLYGAWVTIALWDLIRQESVPIPFRARWMAVVILVPLLGPILYFAWGRSPIPRQLRLMLVAGGALVYALIAVLAAMLGG
ncbi:MAG: right-handed parallel beta-helix repeat-containing protein [Actinomycetota bacterium]